MDKQEELNMNNEEIIEIIEELQREYQGQENENKYNNYTVYKAKRYLKGLQNLLDLYIKEKNKNLLEKAKNTMKVVGANYISKDKIIEKIKELENQKEKIPNELDVRAFYRIRDIINAEIKVLQDLLEE